MRIEKLTFENWLPFGGRQALDLPAGPIAVVARYIDNPRRSNWGGKTALLEAIEWCLFGVHRKRYEDSVIHGDEAETMVRLALTDDVTITRSRRRGKSTKLLLEVGGIGFKQKEAQAKINEILGFTSDDYRATICFSQGDTSAIVEKSSGERRKIVSQWLELEAWLRVTAKIRVQARDAAKAIATTRATLDVLSEHLSESTEDENEEDDDALNQRMNTTRANIDLCNNELEVIAEAEIARLDRLRYERLVKEAQQIRDEIKASNPKDLRHRLDVLTGDHFETSEAAALERKNVTETGRLAKHGFDGQCPVVGKECPARKFVDDSHAEIIEAHASAKERYQIAREKYEATNAELNRIRREDKTIDQKRSSYQTLMREIKTLRDSAMSMQMPEPKQKDVDVARASLKELRLEERAIMAELARRQANAHRMASTLADHERVTASLSKLENDAQVTAVAMRCVGPAGVPAKIAEASLAHLEDRANALLSGSGLSFTFAWDRETKDLTPTCFECGYTYKGRKDKTCPACSAERAMKRADELEILVDDGSGEIEDVKAKSGGAKVLIGSAIRLGAGLMLRELRGSPAAWAQVDEPFGPLDAENRATLAQTFAGMLGAVGLEQAFVVSHDSALLDALPSRIEIVRDGNVSVATMR